MTAKPRSRAARACASALAAPAVAVALALAGCGSASPSQVQLRSQATAICSRTNRRISGTATPANAGGGEAFIERGLAALTPERARLKRLAAPDDAADVWSTALRALDGELAALRAAVARIDRDADPVAAYKALQQTLTPLETQANNAWQALEIPACQNQ